MMSRSYTNLIDLVSGNFPFPAIGGGRTCTGRMPRVPTLPEDDSPTPPPARIIIAGINLPVTATKSDSGDWVFSLDEESLLLQLKSGLPAGVDVIHVGVLNADVPIGDQDEVSQTLLEKFRCVPAFLTADVLDRFFHGFCKRQMWPLLHYMLPFTPDHGRRFDRRLWEAFVAANKVFAEKIVEVVNPDVDSVWIHDYHLMVLPSFLRRRFDRLRIGFFLHSPFPSSEIYRTLPVREELLKAVLNADLIGFHTFDYARHFLSCCSRLLGLDYESKRGYIGLEYFGRTVGIKIMPVGIHMGRLEEALKHRKCRVQELRERFEGKTVVLGVDDLDIFQGINLKLLAFEQMLVMRPSRQGKAVLVQIASPVEGRGREFDEMWKEIEESVDRINNRFGNEDYTPVVYIDRAVSVEEKIAFYTIAECFVVTAVRDGLNLTPYEYIISRQGNRELNPKKSMLVVSEFIGCSPSLSGAIRINPWNVEATAEALNHAVSMKDAEKQLRHEKHYRYVSTHDVAYWAKSFMQDLERNCKEQFKKRFWGFGLGFGFRVVALDPNFRKLHLEEIVEAYQKASSRAVLLDYDGTVMPQTSINKSPNEEVISVMNSLSKDAMNMVFIVSGRGRESLGKWFSPCEKLGIAAEHGYFMRWSGNEEWETCAPTTDFGWMQMAEPVMQLYTESTDGSSIEIKESALVWHYQDADPGFGSSQAKEMLDHLENVLANEPVAVKKGQFIVEVKPQGVSKGLVADKILSTMKRKTKPADFVLCIGDDRSDEDMFEGIGAVTEDLVCSSTSVFACTVGQKPSKATYYVDDTTEVMLVLRALAEVSDKAQQPVQEVRPST